MNAHTHIKPPLSHRDGLDAYDVAVGRVERIRQLVNVACHWCGTEVQEGSPRNGMYSLLEAIEGAAEDARAELELMLADLREFDRLRPPPIPNGASRE